MGTQPRYTTARSHSRSCLLGMSRAIDIHVVYSTLISLEAFVRATDELMARDSRLPGAVHVLHICVGDNKAKTMRFVYGMPADAARATALCPNVDRVYLCLGRTHPAHVAAIRAGTMAAFATKRHVRPLHFAVNETLKRAVPDDVRARCLDQCRARETLWPAPHNFVGQLRTHWCLAAAACTGSSCTAGR